MMPDIGHTIGDFQSLHHAYIVTVASFIMAYGSTPYVGMTLKKNGRYIKSAQMTRLKSALD